MRCGVVTFLAVTPADAELLQQQTEFLHTQATAAFFRQLAPFFAALERSPAIQATLDELRREAADRLTEYVATFATVLSDVRRARQLLVGFGVNVDDESDGRRLSEKGLANAEGQLARLRFPFRPGEESGVKPLANLLQIAAARYRDLALQDRSDLEELGDVIQRAERLFETTHGRFERDAQTLPGAAIDRLRSLVVVVEESVTVFPSERVTERFADLCVDFGAHMLLRLRATVTGTTGPFEHVAGNEMNNLMQLLNTDVARIETELRTRMIEEHAASAAIPTSVPRSTTEAVKLALVDAATLIKTRGPVSAVDRLHTAFHGHLAHLCRGAGLTTKDDASVTELWKVLREQHPKLQVPDVRRQDVDKILRTASAIVDAVNTIRNRASLGHPNDELLGEDEAWLCVDAMRSLLEYVDRKLGAG